jgi:acyl carrier protein
MTREEDELLDVIAAEAAIPRAKLVRSATLEELGLDSMVFAILGFAVEDKYNVRVEPERFAGLETVGELLDAAMASIREHAARAPGE